MSVVSTWPEPDRPATPRTPPDERTSLDTWLEYHRVTLLKKCAGLTAGQLAERTCPPSPLSLLGLVRHMTLVEGWFHAFDGQPRLELYCTDDSPEGDFDAARPETADEDLAEFRASVNRSRAAVAGRSLDDLVPGSRGDPVSLRWVYQHMIEEYARHNGHADLLRERIDGVTGD
jgi:Protein of unknown function (DUF664)